MHKNTFLLVVFLGIISVLVAFVNIRKPVSVSTPSPSPSPNATLITYTNQPCGISFEYPNTLQKMESSTSSAIFISQTNASESIIITCQQDIPRVPLPLEKMETIPIPGSSISATLYHDASQKDGSPIDKLIFTNPDKHIDVFIAGLGEVFNTLIKSIRLL